MSKLISILCASFLLSFVCAPGYAKAPASVTTQSQTVVAKVNLNKATAEDLQQVKGLGEARSHAIVTYRQNHGPFKSVQDLAQVKGISDGLLKKIEDRLVV